MATYQHGINGTFKGKVGTVIGSSWQGIPYMKSLYSLKNKTGVRPQLLIQQDNFIIIGSFLKCLLSIINLGFDNAIKGKSLFSKAMSYALKNSIDTTTTPGTIDYSKILITKGKYTNATGLTVTSGTLGNIVFRWNDNSGSGVGRADDIAVLVAYSPSQKKAIYIISGVVRSSQIAELDVSDCKSQTFETWVSFRRADGTDVSPSIYTGLVAVPSK